MNHGFNDSNKGKVEVLSKEESYALINQVIQQGQLPSVAEDTAFVTAIKSILDGKDYHLAFCTQATYNELEQAGELIADCLYIITDDSTYDDLAETIQDLQNDLAGISENLDQAFEDIRANADEIETKCEKHAGTITFNSESATLANLIVGHPGIKFYYDYETSDFIYHYDLVMFCVKRKSGQNPTIRASYIKANGDVEAITDDTTIYYEYYE